VPNLQFGKVPGLQLPNCKFGTPERQTFCLKALHGCNKYEQHRKGKRKMSNIIIRDLEVNKTLDKKAMASIFGGYGGTQIVKVGTIPLGTFLVGDELKQRYRDCYKKIEWKVEITEYYEDREESFVTNNWSPNNGLPYPSGC
jgi:hypothetical protein